MMLVSISARVPVPERVLSWICLRSERVSGIEVQAIRLLLVDDHEVVRRGLRAIFEDAPDIEVVGEAASVASAIAESARLKPGVVLMDMRLPDGTGFDACREILAERPATRVLILTSYDDEKAMLAAVFAGASGYLLKEIGGRGLIPAVKLVAAGQSILDQSAAKRVRERLLSLTDADETAAVRAPISPQERRVLTLVAKGMSNKEIATALDLSGNTVKHYLASVFDKLHVNRRSQAIAAFLKPPR